MAKVSVSNVRLAGLSAAVPVKEISNYEYELLTESERKLLIKTTGVEKKRMAPKGLATSDLCIAAAEKLIQELNWNRNEIGLLIFISQSRDYFLPSTSTIIQHRLGLGHHCMALDIGLGCSGFVYGLSVAGALMNCGASKKALVMAGDISSATCSYFDKSTFPLFGDAGGVAALEYSASENPWNFDLMSDGSGFESIIIKDGGIRNLISPDSFELEDYAEGIRRSRLNLSLNGLDVFNFSITKVPESIKGFLKEENRFPDSFDYFIMHQANLLMNETIRKKTGFTPDQTPYSIQKFGNTSSASIPLTMVTSMQKELKTKSLNLLLSGFGVGLSWGTVSLSTHSIACPDLIEI